MTELYCCGEAEAALSRDGATGEYGKEQDPVNSGVLLLRYFGCIRLSPTNRTVSYYIVHGIVVV